MAEKSEFETIRDQNAGKHDTEAATDDHGEPFAAGQGPRDNRGELQQVPFGSAAAKQKANPAPKPADAPTH